MANIRLSDISTITENYDYIANTLSFEAVITSLIFGLTIIKTANKKTELVDI